MTKAKKFMYELLIAVLCVTLTFAFSITFVGFAAESSTDAVVTVDEDSTYEVEVHNHSWLHEDQDAIAVSTKGGTLQGGATADNVAHYYVSDSSVIDGVLSLKANITISGYVELCLNGHTLKGIGSGSVIIVIGAANLTLYDCSKEQTGAITGGNASYGGGVYAGGAFTMNGGTITGNTSTYGGGVYTTNTNMTLNSGAITGNTATSGGGVYSEGTFVMNSGTIFDNSAIYGGGVDFNKSFTMTGGEITGNQATYYGGVYVNGAFNVSGTPVIADNENSNVYLPSESTINVIGALKDDDGNVAKIYVTLESDTGEITSGYNSYNEEVPSKYFFADNGLFIGFQDGMPYLTEMVHEHSWSEWSESNNGKGQHLKTCIAETPYGACGSSVEEDHNWSGWTESDDSENHGRSCSDCSAAQTEQHAWDEGVVEDGMRIFTCDTCDATMTVAEPTTGEEDGDSGVVKKPASSTPDESTSGEHAAPNSPSAGDDLAGSEVADESASDVVVKWIVWLAVPTLVLILVLIAINSAYTHKKNK